MQQLSLLTAALTMSEKYVYTHVICKFSYFPWDGAMENNMSVWQFFFWRHLCSKKKKTVPFFVRWDPEKCAPFSFSGFSPHYTHKHVNKQNKYSEFRILCSCQCVYHLKCTPWQPVVIQINFINFASRCQRACKYRLLYLKYFFFLNSVLFLLFSYKTTCTWSNQFCSVQTTKIPVLHYQILHIQNIYKAQVKKLQLPLTWSQTAPSHQKICFALTLKSLRTNLKI